MKLKKIKKLVPVSTYLLNGDLLVVNLSYDIIEIYMCDDDNNVRKLTYEEMIDSNWYTDITRAELKLLPKLKTTKNKIYLFSED